MKYLYVKVVGSSTSLKVTISVSSVKHLPADKLPYGTDDMRRENPHKI